MPVFAITTTILSHVEADDIDSAYDIIHQDAKQMGNVEDMKGERLTLGKVTMDTTPAWVVITLAREAR